MIVNKIPWGVVIESLEYPIVENHLMVTDSEEFSLDINKPGGRMRYREG